MAQDDLINRAVDQFYQVNPFLDKNINEQVNLFNRTILNISHNLIRNETSLCDDRDTPGINDGIKYPIKEENAIFQKLNESFTVTHAILNDIALELSYENTFSKAKYNERLAVKLNDAKTAPKTYQSISRTFFDDQKIPLMSL